MNDDKNLIQDIPLEERAEALKSMADKTEVDKVKRHYNQDEKSQIKDFVTEESVLIMETEEEFSTIKKDFQARLKAKKSEVIKALKDIKRGYSESEEPVFLISDQEQGLMNIYDKNGIYLSSRKLFPEERQTRILEMAKTGTEN